jgi:hypothetical protein
MDFHGFILALFNDWISIMSGTASILFAALGYIPLKTFAFFKKPGMQRKIFWGMALFCFFLSSVSAWTNEHKKAENLLGQLEIKQKNEKIRNTLATFLSEAVVLQNECIGVGIELPPSKNVYQVYADWHKRLYDYINNELGYSYAEEMVDSLSISVPNPIVLSERNAKTWMLTEQSKVRLRELIK